MKPNREEIVKALREQVSNMDYSLYAKFLDGVFQAQATAILKLIEGESQREPVLFESATRDEVVPLYVNLIRKETATKEEVIEMNNNILAKWSSSGLEYIKNKAWKLVAQPAPPEGERERTQKEAEEMLKNPLTIEEAKAQVDRLNKGEREEKPEGITEGCIECGDPHDRAGDFCSDVCRANFFNDDPMQDGQESPFNDNEFTDEDYRF